jgi:DnaK suppressor protein
VKDGGPRLRGREGVHLVPFIFGKRQSSGADFCAAGAAVDASYFPRLSFAFGPRLRERTGKVARFRSENMDKKKLETFKKRLETRQQDLRRTVSRTQADGRSADEDTAQDVADRAASSYTKEFLFSQSNNDRQLLQMVEKALARIREGSFGECIHCGKEINAKRLEAVPWTRHCIECQEKLEQGLLEEAPR